MKKNVRQMPRLPLVIIFGLTFLLGVATAQQPSPSPTPKKTEAKPESTSTAAGEDAGDYTVISSLEVGYRGQKVDGDLNKYRSDLNYKAGPRLFDSSFLMR